MADLVNDNARTNNGISYIPRAVMHSALDNNNINLCHVNIQSLCARQMSKFNEFKMCFTNSKIDIICLTETWLSEDIPNELVAVDGYKLYRNDRRYSRGGGICIYCKNDLMCKVISVSELFVGVGSCDCTEFLFAEICFNGEKFLLGVFYNPPRGDCAEKIEQKLEELSLHYHNVILIGDFNTDLNKASAKRDRLQSIFDNFGLECVSREPTHFYPGGSSLIDLLLTNNTDFVFNFNQVAAAGFSRHDMIFASLNISRCNINNHISYRDYTRIDNSGLQNVINNTDWSILYSIDDPDIALNLFNSYLINIYDSFVPIREFRQSRNNGWFNNDILKAMTERDIAYRLWVSDRSPANHNQYKRLRNRVTHLVNVAKANFVSRTVAGANSSKQLWSKLKQINVTNSSQSNVQYSNTNDEINNYFGMNFSHDSSNLPMAPLIPNGFKFGLTNENEVINAIGSIKSNSIGLDGIPLKFIKYILPLIINQITYIFNLIIKSSKFPCAWKNAKVIPISKKSGKSDLNNLRPISILSALSKAFEKILKTQIQTFIEHQDLLSPYQSGFRTCHSTTSALLKVHDDIHASIDKKGIAFLLLLDFSKAFDRVSHAKLLRKLSENFLFSCEAVNLIKSYLTNRKQSVFINGQYSEFIDIASGVPQGSVLGPILFSMFINDLPSVLKFCKIHLFADDVQIYFYATDLSVSQMAHLVNIDMSKVHEWSIRNLLPLNASKSHAMFITRSRQSYDLPPIVIGNDELDYVNKFSNLGITFQNDFEWDSQVNQQCRKIYNGIRFLRLTADMLPSDIKLKICKSLLLPHFSFGCEFLLNASARAIDRLRVALNFCIRWIFRLSRYTRVTHLQHHLLGCSFYNFIKVRCCLALFRVINFEKPSYLFEKLRPFQGTRNRNFILPQYQTSHYGGTFFVRGIVYWNQLPPEIKAQRNLISFRREIMAWFATRN